MASTGRLVADEDLGLDYSMVVHGEQRFEHARPLHAGDIVVAQSTISDIKNIGRHTMLTTQTDIRTVDGEHVCTARSAIVERGA